MIQFLIVLLFGLIVMWVFIVLPQRRRQAEHAQMIGAMDPGDEVVTAGGLYGTVQEIRDDEVDLEIAAGVTVRVAKRAIAAVYEDEEDEDEPVDEGATTTDAVEPSPR